MTYDKYDLPKWNSFKQNLNPISLDNSITGDNVQELFKTIKEETFMRFKDYFDRKMILKPNVFKEHTSGKYLNKEENRHRLFPHIKDILNNPDEVWYKNPGKKIYNKFQSRYIKFYKDKIVVVDCEMAKDSLQIMTWYESKITDVELRKGLLVKKGRDL